MVEKERSYLVNKTALTKMLPQVYLTCFQSQLSAAELLTLEILVWLLQAHKQVRIERLAALFPEPIKFESRRRRLQRFLILPKLSLPLFRSVKLADWLNQQGVYFALRLKKDSYIQQEGADYQTLHSLGLAPGMKMFFTGVKVTKQQGFGYFNLAAYWKRKYRGTGASKEGWYILTNLESLTAALDAYQARSGIEAMFKDCKTGGYNLEGCHASNSRLLGLVLILALAKRGVSPSLTLVRFFLAEKLRIWGFKNTLVA